MWPDITNIPLTLPIFGVKTLLPGQIYLTPTAARNFGVRQGLQMDGIAMKCDFTKQ